MYLPKEVDRILYSGEQIAQRVKCLGAELTRDYDGKNPLFICVLKGACVFFGDLIRQVECPLQIDFFSVSSYCGKNSTGVVVRDLSKLPDVRGRDVVIVEDILDTGHTLSRLKKDFLEREPASIKIAVLLDKECRREVKGFTADYTGFVVDDLFVVGYGLDYNQDYRNLPYIGVLKA